MVITFIFIKIYNKLTFILLIQLFRPPMQVSVSEWNNLLCYHSEMLNGAIPIKILFTYLLTLSFFTPTYTHMYYLLMY